MRSSPKKSATLPAARVSKQGRLKPQVSKADPRVQDGEKFLLPTYKRQPFLLEHGRGCYVYDADGKKYLDFLGGIAVNALGHAHPGIVKVIRREATRAIHISNLYHHAYQGPLARKLAKERNLDLTTVRGTGPNQIQRVPEADRVAALFFGHWLWRWPVS